MFQSFEELDVWKRACQVTVSIFELLSECKVFSLRDQMQRSAVSVASNIAEGCERGGQEFIRFLTIARGSCAELRTQCYIACKIGILTTEQLIPLVAELKELSMMMTGLANSIRKRLDDKE